MELIKEDVGELTKDVLIYIIFVLLKKLGKSKIILNDKDFETLENDAYSISIEESCVILDIFPINEVPFSTKKPKNNKIH